MKHSRWLLVLILILLCINVIFFTLWYALDVQSKVKVKVEELLSQSLGGKLKIQKLSINDRHITANQTSFIADNGKLSLSIPQIQIRYNLLRILISGFRVSKAVQSITITDPNATLTYDYAPQPDKKPTKIPDLTPYFQLLTIRKGNLQLNLNANLDGKGKQKIVFREALSNLELKVTNRKTSELSLQTHTARGGDLELTATLNQGLLTHAKAQITGYKPNQIEYSLLDKIDTEVSVVADYSQADKKTAPRLDYNVILWNTGAVFQEYKVSLPYSNIVGNLQQTRFELSSSTINNHRFKGSGVIQNPLQEASARINLTVQQADLAEFSPEIKGIASGTVLISGTLKDVTAKAEISIARLTVKQQIISNVKATANYHDDIISFAGSDIVWQNQKTSVSGSYSFSQKTANITCQSNPLDNTGKLCISTDLSAVVFLADKQPYGNMLINKLDFHNPDYTFNGLHGTVLLPQVASPPTAAPTMPIQLKLASAEGFSLEGSGDILSRAFTAQLNMNKFQPTRNLVALNEMTLSSVLSGKVDIAFRDNALNGNAVLKISTKAPVRAFGELSSSFDYNLTTRSGNLNLLTKDFYTKDTPLSLDLQAGIIGSKVTVSKLKVNDEFIAHGWVNLKDWRDASVIASGDSLDFAKYWEMFDSTPSPLALNVDVDLKYNGNNDGLVAGNVRGKAKIVDILQPLDVDVGISGSIDKMDLQAIISHGINQVAKVSGFMKLNPDMEISVQGDVNKTKLDDIFNLPGTKGSINGDIAWQLKLDNWQLSSHTFAADVTGKKLLLNNVSIDTLRVDVAQTDTHLIVNDLLLKTKKQILLTGNGALDFNLLRYSYMEGNSILHVAIEGDVLKWLKDSTPYLESAKGYTKCQLSIQAKDDGFHVNNGILTLTRGVIKLKDQVESIDDIELHGTISNDVLTLDKCAFQMGTGRLYIRNAIDPGGDNFSIGQLNLGYLLLRTDEGGINISIPEFVPKGSVVTAELKGQNSKEATVKGPFDDMKIKAEVICSNGGVVYPANSSNLMQLIESFRKSFNADKPDSYPLPMQLDLLIRVADNVKYITYPANFVVQPGSYMRLTYDGANWAAPEGEFNSEQGTLDFFGTVFNADFIRVAFNDKQNVMGINGTMIKRTPDGSTVTLTITTNARKAAKFWDQLEFALSSDNPEDKSSTQVLSRLRYNRSIEELTPDQRQNLLKDEALQLVGSNLNSSLLGQMLNPLENQVRRFLRLDSFTISTGFIQNLFMEYGTSNQQKASFSDANNLNADILQFSSSVFLNNLSLSMGKYLGRSMFLDYQIQLQETTDLQAKTALVLYHNTTLRVYLPWNLKLNYTFSIRPEREKNTHEVMLQRSFRF